MTFIRWAVLALAILYPVALAGVVLAFLYVGERWWVTGVALYAPKILFGVPLPFLVAALTALDMRRLLWTQAVAAVVLLFPLMGFVVPRPRAVERRAPAMRVLSYNVESGRGGMRYDEVVAEVDRYSPDVAVLVETAWSDRLLPLVEARYPATYASSQFVIGSRYPIVERSEPDKVVFNGQPHMPRYLRLVLETPLGRVVLYVVHPISPRESLRRVGSAGKRVVLSGGAITSIGAGSFYANSGLREQQASAFSEAAKREKDPVVIAGDTNLPDLSLVLRRTLSSFQDGFARAGWGFGYTFPTDEPLPPWLRIDRILASDGLRFVRFQVGTSAVSDHRCIVADLQRP